MTKTVLMIALTLAVIGATPRIAASVGKDHLAFQATPCVQGNFASFQCYAALV